jgi:hypothetical protein
MKWLPLLFLAWNKALEQFCAVASGQHYVLIRTACDFLRYIYLPYELWVRLRDYKNIPNQPCLCGRIRLDGTQPTFRECCWRRR